MPDPPGQSESETQISGKAVAAAACALGSILACAGSVAAAVSGNSGVIVVVFALPLLGLTATGLGLLGLREIKRGQGRITGRFPALIGVFLGLLSAVVQGAFGFGVLRTYMDNRNALAPAVGRAFTELDQDQWKLASMGFTPEDQKGPSRERLESVVKQLHAELGACRGAEFDWSVFQESIAVASAVPKSTAAQAPMPADLPRPTRLVFERGTALVLCFLNDRALEAGEVRLNDAMILPVPSGGSITPVSRPVIVLLADGPGAKLAKSIGLSVDGPAAPAK